VAHSVAVLADDHPVAAGLPSVFPLKDELYLYEVFDQSITPLLSSDYSFTNNHFYSAYHAVTGKMFCNDDWPHPAGSSLIGWTKTAGASRICYLQPGDGPDTYASEHYRQLLENAIRWAAEKS
jgi:type 1 glutamine amidotransferase